MTTIGGAVGATLLAVAAALLALLDEFTRECLPIGVARTYGPAMRRTSPPFE